MKNSRLTTAVLALLLWFFLNTSPAFAQSFYVAPSGSDITGSGSQPNPWQSIGYAIDNVPDGATIEVGPGLYNGRVRLDQQFNSGVVINSTTPYGARLRYNGGAVVICYTCQGVTLQGFDIAHAADNTDGLVIQIQDLLGAVNGSDGGTDPVVSRVVLRNNVIHDSNNNDLLKINNGAEDVLVEGNMFYNQAGSDEHIDVNSTADVVIQDNVFFNTGSQSATSSFVVIKDSNGSDDTILGARNTTVRRNILLNWQGSDGQGFLRVGEDSTANFEADGVLVENNLLLGNSNRLMRSAFTVQGSRNVTFHYNTVVGNLASRSYAARLIALDSNQLNQQVKLENNIWSDPTGTMGTEGFIGVDVFEASAADNTASVTLNNNLYYNGAAAIPSDSGQFINIGDDSNALVGDPGLPNQSGLTLPVWNGSQFGGGFSTISDVFVHLAQSYGTPGQSGAGIDQATALNAPADDLLGNARGFTPDIGAVEMLGDDPPVDPPVDPPESEDFDTCYPVRHSGASQRHSLVCF